ncbi:GntR family transcriptional regulator [Cellulomonas sp. Leaf395]|uniref:GntR family transcriptional regulator n=1 Tax=Cellulomonas sp. Leaf395 TaxID=1736362 RepID=UPI0006FB16E4|nr:GntR family transcriptional regulator [Cellulomonas sp. Leaf395]KQS99494.1 GntR family transcriptional regulator [Cellulomonas sp. Leaf395]
MTAGLEVDLTSGVPAFEQIRAQVVAHVAAGRLVAGDRLPTIRALATDLGLAAGTVARAFRELEAEGVVETRRRAGTVIAEGASVPTDIARRAAETYVTAVRAAGLSDDEALVLVHGALLGRQSVTPTSTGSGSSSTPKDDRTPSRT